MALTHYTLWDEPFKNANLTSLTSHDVNLVYSTVRDIEVEQIINMFPFTLTL